MKLTNIFLVIFILMVPNVFANTSKTHGISYYEIAVRHLKEVEGYRDKMYYCGAGAPTIFWGKKIEKGKEAYYESLDKKEQQYLFRDDFLERYTTVEKKYPHLVQREKLAVTLLMWNVGNLGKDLDKALKEYDISNIEKYWMKYVYYKPKGKKRKKKSSHLIMRREFELKLFNGLL